MGGRAGPKGTRGAWFHRDNLLPNKRCRDSCVRTTRCASQRYKTPSSTSRSSRRARSTSLRWSTRLKHTDGARGSAMGSLDGRPHAPLVASRRSTCSGHSESERCDPEPRRARRVSHVRDNKKVDYWSSPVHARESPANRRLVYTDHRQTCAPTTTSRDGGTRGTWRAPGLQRESGREVAAEPGVIGTRPSVREGWWYWIVPGALRVPEPLQRHESRPATRFGRGRTVTPA